MVDARELELMNAESDAYREFMKASREPEKYRAYKRQMHVGDIVTYEGFTYKVTMIVNMDGEFTMRGVKKKKNGEWGKELHVIGEWEKVGG